MIGESVGSYEIVSKLGEGGMGTVYIAKHKLMGSRAAVKLLLPELSCHKAVVDRFFNEARAATMIKHSGIITVFDFGYTANGNAYIVMELLEGESLTNRIIRAGSLDEATAIRLGRQVARALDAAHVAGIVHRDLKPDNIFVIPDDDYPGGERIKVLDFGIAKLSVNDGSAGQTRAGVTMGSPLYMSPEQCQGQVDIDARADIYSFGCVMFHMMNGRPPFGDAASTNIVAILAQHISTPPPDLRALDGRVSAGMAEIVTRMLQKQREHRYASMAEITSAFDRLSAGKFVTRPISAPIVADAGDTGTMLAAGAPGKASITGSGSSTVLGMSPAKKGATGSQPAVGSRPGIAPTVIASSQANQANQANPAIQATRPPHEVVSAVSKSSVTTLGESAGQVTGSGMTGSSEWSPPPSGKGKWIAIAGAAVVALGVGGYFVFAGGGEAVATNEPAQPPAGKPTVSASSGEHAGAPTGEQPSKPAGEAGEPDEQPAQPEQPEQPAQADKISVELKSEPSGAQVFRASDGSLLGATPFWYDIDRSPGELPVIVRHDGFEEARVTLSAADGGKHSVTLNKAAEQPIQNSSPGKKARSDKSDKSDKSGSRKKRGWGELM